MKEYIQTYIKSSIDTKSKILADERLVERIEIVSKVIINAYKAHKKVLIAGNGGSAADAQHIAAELVSKFLKERHALSAIALTTNTSILTSVGNDYDHKLVFARQVQAHGNEGDVLIAISTSGKSQNVLKAVEEAKKLGLIVIGLTGQTHSPMDESCDYILKVPSELTPIIQESHIMIAHIICALVEKQV
jgi:D-sedoheptulose 7-phosphate isomerase